MPMPKNAKTGKNAEILTTGSEGLADAEGLSFYEPEFGSYVVEGAANLKFFPGGEGKKDRYQLKLKIVEGETVSGEDPAGRTYTHTFFVAQKPSPDDPDYDRLRRNRGLDLGKIKSACDAFGVTITKAKDGSDTWEDGFTGVQVSLQVEPTRDKDSGEIRISEKTGKPWKNFYFHALAQED